MLKRNRTGMPVEEPEKDIRMLMTMWRIQRRVSRRLRCSIEGTFSPFVKKNLKPGHYAVVLAFRELIRMLHTRQK